MIDSNITMEEVHFTLKSIYKDNIFCVFSDFNSENIILRIRLNDEILRNKKKEQLKVVFYLVNLLMFPLPHLTKRMKFTCLKIFKKNC